MEQGLYSFWTVYRGNHITTYVVTRVQYVIYDLFHIAELVFK